MRMAGLTWNRRNPFADGAAEDGGLVTPRPGARRRALPARGDRRPGPRIAGHLRRDHRPRRRRACDLHARRVPVGQRPPSQPHRRPATRPRRSRRDVRTDAASARIGPEQRTLARVVDHLEHAAEVVGIDRVCLGGDFTTRLSEVMPPMPEPADRLMPAGLKPGAGIEGLKGPEDYPALLAALDPAEAGATPTSPPSRVATCSGFLAGRCRPADSERRAAVGQKRRAVDIGSIVGEQPRNERCDLLRPAEPAGRDLGRELGDPVACELAHGLAVDRAGRDRVDGDAGGREGCGRPAGEREQPGLRGRVWAPVTPRPRNAESEAMLTTRPAPRSRRYGPTARIPRNGPRRFVASTSSHSAGSISKRSRTMVRAAALTSAPRSPASCAAATARAHASGSRTSMATGTALPPSSSASAAIASPSTSARTTAQPSAWSRRAIAAPMPRPAPVTIATVTRAGSRRSRRRGRRAPPAGTPEAHGRTCARSLRPRSGRASPLRASRRGHRR